MVAWTIILSRILVWYYRCMDISYVGHSCFKLKTSKATVVTDPYDKSVGFVLPKLSADVVTISHDHADHNNSRVVGASSRRKKPFVIDSPGEYDIGGVSVFGVSGYHDDKKGELRGKNIMYSIVLDEISVAHMGDLGHTLTNRQVEELNGVDVLICPVGGHYTIDPKLVSEVVGQLDPSYFIPMHYKTNMHDAKTFAELIEVQDFLKIVGSELKTMDKLSVSKGSLPEETEFVVLSQQVA